MVTAVTEGTRREQSLVMRLSFVVATCIKEWQFSMAWR